MVDSESMHKPTFDGRQAYYIVMRDIMRVVSATSVNVDGSMSLYRSLRVLYNMVAPYIKPSDRVRIKESLRKAHFKLCNLDRQRMIDNPVVKADYVNKINRVDLDLLDIHEDIHESGRDVFLTTSGGEKQELDMNKLIEDMGL